MEQANGLGAAMGLPRLAPRGARAAPLWDALGLLVAALSGAGLTHLLAYHTPTCSTLGPTCGAAVATLLAHCPLRLPLALTAIVATLALGLAIHETWRLRRLSAALGKRLPAPRLADPSSPEPLKRSPLRLAGFVVAILATQSLLLSAIQNICPMRVTMIMNGMPMAMAHSAVLPLWPLHLVIATLMALLLWRVERRLTRLRAEVARRLRLLRKLSVGTRAPAPAEVALPWGWWGASLFARPPPFA